MFHVKPEGTLTCGCRAYEDVFTYNRWKAQGYYVKRGEHGIKLPVIKRVDREDPDTGEEKTIRIRGRAHVFCRHQVEARS